VRVAATAQIKQSLTSPTFCVNVWNRGAHLMDRGKLLYLGRGLHAEHAGLDFSQSVCQLSHRPAATTSKLVA